MIWQWAPAVLREDTADQSAPSGMRVAVPPLLLNAFTACTGITLALTGAGDTTASLHGGLNLAKSLSVPKEQEGMAGAHIRTGSFRSTE